MSAASAIATQYSAMEPLSDEFVRGWHKLHEELKIEVFKCSLTSDDGVMCIFVPDNPFTLRQELHEHLAMGLEIATLARDTFYKSNVFRVKIYGSGSRARIRLPLLGVSNLIRKVHFTLFLSTCNWRKLRVFAEGKYGFENLRRLALVFKKYDHPAPECSLFRINPPNEQIVFSCAGTIEFVGTRIDRRWQKPRSMWEKCESRVKEMVVFGK